jgi:hypothetical protein
LKTTESVVRTADDRKTAMTRLRFASDALLRVD